MSGTAVELEANTGYHFCNCGLREGEIIVSGRTWMAFTVRHSRKVCKDEKIKDNKA